MLARGGPLVSRKHRFNKSTSSHSLGAVATQNEPEESYHEQITSALLAQQSAHEKKVERLLEEHFVQVTRLLSAPPRYTCRSSVGRYSTDRCSTERLEQPRESKSAAFFAGLEEDDAVQPAQSEYLADADAGDVGFAISPRIQRPSSLESEDEGSPAASRTTWRDHAGMTMAQLEQTTQGDQGKPGGVVKTLTRVSQCGNIKEGVGSVAEDLRYGRVGSVALKITQHPAFEYFFQAIIIVNAVFLGLEQDWQARNVGQPPSMTYFFIDVAFGALFLVELIIRICASGLCAFFSLWDADIRWHIFDTILVCSSVIEIALKLSTEEQAFDASMGRLLRLLRLVRIVRVLRVFRFFKVLRIMVLSILASFRPLVFALALLFILIYIFAVCLLQFVTEEIAYLSLLTGGTESHLFKVLKRSYGSLSQTTYTLFLSISGGVSWGEAADPLFAISFWLGMLFIMYVAFSIFCVLNIITGIFVEEASAITAEDEENMMMHEIQKRKRFVNEVKRFFDEADEDGSGQLSWAEFSERMQNVRMQKLLENLGIDVVGCGARNIFDLFDNDNNGSIAIGEFTSALTQMRGLARSADLASLRYEHGKTRRDLRTVLKILAPHGYKRSGPGGGRSSSGPGGGRSSHAAQWMTPEKRQVAYTTMI